LCNPILGHFFLSTNENAFCHLIRPIARCPHVGRSPALWIVRRSPCCGCIILCMPISTSDASLKQIAVIRGGEPAAAGPQGGVLTFKTIFTISTNLAIVSSYDWRAVECPHDLNGYPRPSTTRGCMTAWGLESSQLPLGSLPAFISVSVSSWLSFIPFLHQLEFFSVNLLHHASNNQGCSCSTGPGA
jgi:hypothetical protein